jgi:hypothetical protein
MSVLLLELLAVALLMISGFEDRVGMAYGLNSLRILGTAVFAGRHAVRVRNRARLFGVRAAACAPPAVWRFS